jgi:hypothetical protein
MRKLSTADIVAALRAILRVMNYRHLVGTDHPPPCTVRIIGDSGETAEVVFDGAGAEPALQNFVVWTHTVLPADQTFSFNPVDQFYHVHFPADRLADVAAAVRVGFFEHLVSAPGPGDG